MSICKSLLLERRRLASSLGIAAAVRAMSACGLCMCWLWTGGGDILATSSLTTAVVRYRVQHIDGSSMLLRPAFGRRQRWPMFSCSTVEAAWTTTHTRREKEERGQWEITLETSWRKLFGAYWLYK
jgi:hypothetical protein